MEQENIRLSEPGSAWNLASIVSVAQGVFYVVTGLWPIVHSASFERVTGPKADLWLVKTVGALISVVGGILLLAGFRRRTTPETAALAVGSAASLSGADLIYTAKKRISPVYLLDAVAELGLVALWAAGLMDARRSSSRPDYQI